jgi:hypothetical protein
MLKLEISAIKLRITNRPTAELTSSEIQTRFDLVHAALTENAQVHPRSQRWLIIKLHVQLTVRTLGESEAQGFEAVRLAPTGRIDHDRIDPGLFCRLELENLTFGIEQNHFSHTSTPMPQIYHRSCQSARNSGPSVLETGEVDSGIDLGPWVVLARARQASHPTVKWDCRSGQACLTQSKRESPRAPKFPLAFLEPVRYTLEVSLHAGITNSRTALAQRIVPERF